MHRFRRMTHHPWLWLIPMLWMAPPLGHAASPSTIMSKAMIAMMDTMGELAHRFKNNSDWDFNTGSSPYSGWNRSPWGGSGYRYPGYNPGMIPPPYANPTNHKSVVDGIWIGRGGEIVLVMYGHFRIYANAEVYRDGRYRIVGNKLYMLDPETDLVQAYDYLLEEGKMIIRSESGALLYFKQLPIPIPPYTLIHGIKSPR